MALRFKGPDITSSDCEEERTRSKGESSEAKFGLQKRKGGKQVKKRGGGGCGWGGNGKENQDPGRLDKNRESAVSLERHGPSVEKREWGCLAVRTVLQANKVKGRAKKRLKNNAYARGVEKWNQSPCNRRKRGKKECEMGLCCGSPTTGDGAGEKLFQRGPMHWGGGGGGGGGGGWRVGVGGH